MATLVLGAAGAAIGGSIGGAILGVSAATIGGFIGSSIGSVVDSWIISSLAPTQRIEGARLDTLRITSATEGAVIHRVVTIRRIVPRVPAIELEQLLLDRTTGDAVLADGGEHFREQGDDFYAHEP